MKSARMKPAVQVYAENIDKEQGYAEEEARKKKLLKLGAISGWSIAVLVCVSVAPLLHLQHIIATVIVVDRATGDYRVEREGQSLVSFNDPDFNRRATSDLGKFVKAHEGFTRGEADSNYKTVWLMSAPELRGQWDAYYKPDLNKESPLNFMQPADGWSLENLSYSFIPSSEPSVRVAQVRYDLIKRQGQLPTTSQRMVSTVTFKYDKSNVPENMDDYTINAFGFPVTNYRRDADGPIRQLTTVGAAQQGYAPAYPQQPAPAPQYPQPAQAVAAAPASAATREGLKNLVANGATK